jgi:hypothetical protein
MEKRFEETTYVICHNGADVIHPIQVEPGTVLTSGQPNVEEFADKAAWEARLKELGYSEEKLASLAGPDSLRAGRGAKAGRPAGLLTPEERKALKPEERKALRAERMAALKAAKPA